MPHPCVTPQVPFWPGRLSSHRMLTNPDSKVHVTNMGPIWVLSAPGGPHIGPRNHVIREVKMRCYSSDIAQESITMTSQWVGWRLKSPASRLFTQPFIRAQNKESIKAPRHWPLCGEFTWDRWITRTNGQLRGKCFHLMTSSWHTYNTDFFMFSWFGLTDNNYWIIIICYFIFHICFWEDSDYHYYFI